MLGKLIKYELMSTYRTFFLLFGIIIVTTLTAIGGDAMRLDLLSILGTSGLVFIFIPTIIIYLYTVIQRYSKNLYGSEGYLMFTLPVKTWQILLSKLLTSVLWAIAIGVVACLAALIFIIYVAMSEGPLPTFGELKMMFDQIFLFIEPASIGIVFCTALIGGALMILMIYTSITLANLPMIRRANTFAALLFYFLLAQGIGHLQSLVLRSVYSNAAFQGSWDTPYQLNSFVQGLCMPALLYGIGACIVLFSLISYVIGHNVHLK